MGVRLVQQLTASVVCCSLALQSWMRLYARAPWRCYGTRAHKCTSTSGGSIDCFRPDIVRAAYTGNGTAVYRSLSLSLSLL
jgi:hypothetical protein